MINHHAMKTKIIFTVLALLCIPIFSISQVNSNNQNTSNTLGFGFDVGITTFFGDIDESAAQGDLSNNIAYRLSVNKSIGYWFFVEGQILVGNLSGEKKRGSGEQLSYLYFNTKFNEFSLNADINVISLFTKKRSPKFNLLVGGGLGIITFKSKLIDGNTDAEIDSYGYSGEPSSPELTGILGLKATYKISNHFYVLGQTSQRVVNTDFLDSKEGGDKWDSFNFTSVGLVYKIFLGRSSKSKFSGFGEYTKNVNRKRSKSTCATWK